MGIIEKLNANGMTVLESDQFFRGYFATEKGIVASYDENKCQKRIYFLTDKRGKILPCCDKMIHTALDENNFTFNSADLYAEYYNFEHDKDLESVFRYGYSAKSRECVEKTMKEIGLIRYTDVNNGSGEVEGVPSKFDVLRQSSLFVNTNINIGKYSESEWIAQVCHQTDVDDFAVLKMYFNHEPTDKDLKTAYSIQKFDQNPIEIFRCNSCGRLTNWLDIDGDFTRKLNKAADNYCGC